MERNDVAVARDAVVSIDLLALVDKLARGQPGSQDALDGNEWRAIVGEIASAVSDAVCAVAELSFELEAAIVDDDASEVGDEIGFAGSFGVHGEQLKKCTRRSEEAATRTRRGGMEKGRPGKEPQRGGSAGNNKVSEGRGKKRIKNEGKQRQTEGAEIGAGPSEFASTVTGPAKGD